MRKKIQRSPDILVVDDDDEFRRFVHGALSEEGLTVHEGRSGKEALAAFNKGSYDLMLLDFKLPDMSGFDVLKSVREKSPTTDVVVVTGYKDINLAVDLFTMGAKEYVTKPVEPSELIQRVRAAVRRRTAEQRVTQLQFDFYAKLYQDLQNPLHTVMATLEYVQKNTAGKLSERQHLLLENMKTSLHQMNLHLDDLVTNTLLESGKIEFVKLPTNIDELLPGICERFRPRITEKRILLTVRTKGKIPTVEIDATRIEQVIGNLLDNAIKYTDRGEIRIELTCAKTRMHGRLRDCVGILIADTGEGISKKEIPLVFDKYKDMLIGKSSNKRTTGLGLAICRHIIEAHNGTISVESIPGKGSTFKILLPIDIN